MAITLKGIDTSTSLLPHGSLFFPFILKLEIPNNRELLNGERYWRRAYPLQNGLGYLLKSLTRREIEICLPLLILRTVQL